MRFREPLIPGRLLRRYQRFFVDVRLDDGRVVVAHCPNTGSMKTCIGPDWPVLLSHQPSPTRKLAYTLELTNDGHGWIGVNPALANRLALEAIRQGVIAELQGFDEWRPEQPYGEEGSRVDLLGLAGRRRCYVEVKSVSMLGEDDRAAFPDAPTSRGQKHLRELTTVLHGADRAVLLFIVQRSGCFGFRPAKEIDPAYTLALRRARAAGVELLAYRCRVTPAEIRVWDDCDIKLPGGRLPRARG